MHSESNGNDGCSNEYVLYNDISVISFVFVYARTKSSVLESLSNYTNNVNSMQTSSVALTDLPNTAPSSHYRCQDYKKSSYMNISCYYTK